MDEIDKIPTGKIQRASKFMAAGARVGGNYVKHYAKKMFDESSVEDLHRDNAQDIYTALSELKGSALKVAQMLSMNDALPDAYNKQFAMAQYNAPPLSYPLIVNIFRKNLGKAPSDLFDVFEPQAANAASIGQVHRAWKNGHAFAVKIQYPGIADSIHADLKMVKPFATTLMNISRDEVDYYMEEVESKLIEETDYSLELRQSIELSDACAHIQGVSFTKYYPEYSTKQVLTMDWVEGEQFGVFLQTNPTQELRNKIGQSLWDFYMHQIHTLRKVHADPHPGNFIVRHDSSLVVIDFGCVKSISDDFYRRYFAMTKVVFEADNPAFLKALYDLKMILDDDTPTQKAFFAESLAQMMALVGRPFREAFFDFGEPEFLKSLFEKGKAFGENPLTRKAKMARGIRDSIYVNRTHFGLFSILHELKAVVETKMDRYIADL